MPSAVNRRWLLLLLAGAIVVIVGIPQAERLAADRELLKPYDFVQYWSAGRQLLDGRDSFDPDQLVSIQRSVYDGVRKAVMMWNPPWTLPIALPFAALPWRLAQFLWLGLQFVAVLLSADLLWRIYGGAAKYRWIAWLIALTFAPTLFLLLMGQISGLPLLGITGFLWFLRKDRPYLAGCCAALTAIKPHLFVLFALVLAFEATRDKRIRKAILAGGCALLALALLPMLWNAHVWTDYFEAMRRPPSENFETMSEFEHPTIGYQMRLLIPGQPFAAQFIPLGFAIIGYCFICGRAWQWERDTPLLLLVSAITAGYGAWAFDLVILLPAVILLAIQLWACRKWLIGVVAGLHLLLNSLVLMTVREVGSQSNPWIAPVVGSAYIAIALRTKINGSATNR